jgi:outer membrane protein assembly factor BamB
VPAGLEKPPTKRGRALLLGTTVAVVLAISAAVIFLLLGSSSPSSGRSSRFSSGGSSGFAGSRYPNVDVLNTRYARGSIRSATVSELDVAWTLPITARGSYGGNAASAVAADGIAYIQDLDSNVQAIALQSGKQLWKHSYGSPTEGPNGVLVATGRVYGATETKAFALDQKTGDEIWARTLTRSGAEKISMAPGYHSGLAYVSTVPAGEAGGGVGTLWALDGKTGKKAWHFETVPRDLWGNRKVNSGGGLLYAPAFDTRGSMYFGVGNPGPIPGTKRYPWGSSRPGPNLYTDSIVKLSAETGKLQWYYQLKPHDLCNGDIGPPVLVKADGRALVIAAGKSGVVVALDRRTGKPVWKRSVGVHNGHDNDGLYAMRGEYSKLKTPMTIFPGSLGGVFAPLSTNGSSVFVPIVNYGTVLVSQTTQGGIGSIKGELVALNVATGAVEWKHKFPQAPFGATTAVNDLVLATTADGTMYAFDGDSGREVWETSLPAGINAGLTVSGNTLLAAAGLIQKEGQAPKILAYRLPS